MAHIGNDAELRAGALGFAVGDSANMVSGAAGRGRRSGAAWPDLPSMPVARSLRALRNQQGG